MTRANAKELLVKLGIENPTDEQITEILNPVKAEIDAERGKADKYKSDAEKLAEVQQELEDLKTQGMSETEKALKEAKKIQAEAEAAKADYTRKSNKVEIEKVLVAGGLKTEDYEKFIDGIVGDDLEQSKTLASAFVETISKQTAAAMAAKEKELLDNTDKPGGGAGGSDKLSEQEELVKSIVGGTAESKDSAEIIGNYI